MGLIRPHFSPRQLIAIAVLGMALLGGGIYFGVNYAVDLAVRADARQKAGQWADYFLTVMPDLDRLIAEGRLDDAQHEVVETARSLGDVFRFKLFDPKARQILVSDAEPGEPDEESPEFNAEAAEALVTGEGEIEVQSGAPGLPALYVEAYVPIRSDDGRERGVVEVYIDQTQTADLLRTTFAALAVGLAIVTALAFGLPTIGFLLRSRQATEAREEARFLAHHDALTGLLNRAAFGEALDGVLREAAANGEPVAVVTFDIDDFEAINDGFGQAAGDEFLRHVARCLSGVHPDGALVARPGQDEFVMAVHGLARPDVISLVEAVTQVVSEPISIHGRAVSGRLSAGVYFAGTPAGRDEALHRSGVALVQAKLDGHGLYRIFTEDMEEDLRARRELERLIERASADRSFEIVYQPLLNAETKRVAGFEALLRLPDGRGGLVSPSVFIPVVESMGLICEVGRWVLEQACLVAATWPQELFVSVNLSAKQFGDGELVGNVRRALENSRLQPHQLELEVTESMLVNNTGAVATQIAELRALGVSIAMDDFGTGYSSLAYLWQFGFDKLKIDRSFISALDHNEGRARELLDTIIMLGHKLGMTVTAEGIETEHHARVLAGLAADHFQGFLYGRPVPVEAIAPFLLANLGPTAVVRAPAPGRRRA